MFPFRFYQCIPSCDLVQLIALRFFCKGLKYARQNLACHQFCSLRILQNLLIVCSLWLCLWLLSFWNSIAWNLSGLTIILFFLNHSTVRFESCSKVCMRSFSNTPPLTFLILWQAYHPYSLTMVDLLFHVLWK